VLPDDKTIMIEHYKDETGIQQMMVHSVFGKPVNEPLAILLAEAAKRITNTNINYLSDDDAYSCFPMRIISCRRGCSRLYRLRLPGLCFPPPCQLRPALT
jgi:ATP-dependent Lhr-like helicase